MSTHRDQDRPLAGLRVVECATFVAGPSGGMALAQLGADVIRVDPIGGGPDHRRWPVAPAGGSLYWNGLNKGKRSVTVDLSAPEGRELVTALITAPGPQAGILLENTGRAWLSHETLAKRRPDLIQLRIQGHADGRPAVDYTVNAATGVPGVTGPETTAAPVNHVLPAWDLLTGMTATTGLLAALHRRQRTGRGGLIELALADVALASVANLGWLAEAQTTGRDRAKQGNHLYGSFGVDFPTRDRRRVMVVALTASQWRSLCRVTGTEKVFAAMEEALRADFSQDADRYRWRKMIEPILRPWFEDRTAEEAGRELGAARVLWGPYRTFTEVLERERENPLIADVEQPGAGAVASAGSPLRWSGTGPVPPVAAPRLGAHTHEVLSDVLGLTQADLSRLSRAGVIRGASPDR
ncbi:2-methylfumaryl-CoA isomerase [Actinoallomurus oryzae]|uniref:2-methylfumaryl-CoA isomerase n=1 Tax=Actinoallomurus oryzae TaxID=502180 RepID=A0ABP8P6Z7_9ACTN